jgi:hypothetical protein
MTNQVQVEANIAATNAKIEATNAAVTTLVDTLKKQQSAYKSFERLQTKANAKLHAVLGEAFTAYADLMTDDECVDSKAKINLFKEKVKEQKSRFAKASTAATSLQLRIVRYVCGDAITDKTATNYARVIKVAYDNAVQNMDMTFSEWVIVNKGIDNVRATKTGEAPKDFLVVGKRICVTRNAEAAVEAAADSGHEFSVALVRTNDDGTQDIVWSTNKEALTNAALKAAGKALDGKAEQQDAEEAQIAAEEELNAAADSSATVQLVSNEYQLEQEAV